MIAEVGVEGKLGCQWKPEARCGEMADVANTVSGCCVT